MNAGFRELFQSYSSAISGDVSRFAVGQERLTLPIPDPSLLSGLFRRVESLFALQPIIIQVPTPCIVVGDIHGQLLDLFRIIHRFGLPGWLTYLFLGDIVDRGEFSVECVIVVFLLCALWPENVFVIRGNHEFISLCSNCGFMSQMMEFLQSNALYKEAVQAFAQMPLAARIGDSILCVHGGIGPGLTGLRQILALKRPIEEFGDDIVDSLVWSDPDPNVDMFVESDTRGAGYRFGEAALVAFLEHAGLATLVRAHECVLEGASEMFNGRLITVFSASNYGGLLGNDAAVLEVHTTGRQIRTFSPLPWLLRSAVQFTGALPHASSKPVKMPALASDLGVAVKKGLLPSGSLGSLKLPMGAITPRMREAVAAEAPLAPLDPSRGTRAKQVRSLVSVKGTPRRIYLG
jgi:protein phosphatase